VRPGPHVYVQTRGTARAADYAFLCGAPPHTWWREYRDVTAFDHPTVLVVSDGGGWTAYLSGIPSARVDAVGTVVRYTLVLDGPCGDGPVAAQLPAAVAAWLDDVADGLAGRVGRRLSGALDARLPPDDVQRWLGAPPPLAPGSDVTAVSEPGRRVLDALAALRVPGARERRGPGDWIGGVGSAPARAAFVTRVAELVAGTPGRALLLNLVGPADVGSVLDPASPVAVLLESADPAPQPLGPAVEAKKAPAPAHPRRAGAVALAGAALSATATAVLVAAVLLTALLMLVLAVW
jgi:hypothetical protein